jgi:hypothetical protein
VARGPAAAGYCATQAATNEQGGQDGGHGQGGVAQEEARLLDDGDLDDHESQPQGSKIEGRAANEARRRPTPPQEEEQGPGEIDGRQAQQQPFQALGKVALELVEEGAVVHRR